LNATAKPLLGARVLVVEDDEDTRDLYGMALEDAGAEVRTANDAQDAMRILLGWQPSVVVSDLSLPRMDGGELLREMRSIEQLRHIPAIAVSGWSGAKDRADAQAAGFQAHLVKPLEPDELVAVVKQWAG
jgi:CheY-like chemotaxis protein